MTMKTHKRKKSRRMHGRGMGSHGRGSRKKGKGKGHHGGKGMAGTGKRADQKKTLVIKLYGNKYFGKQGVTSRKTERDKRKRINIEDIEKNLEKYGKKTENGFEINLENYKILGGSKEYMLKNKLIIKAKEASKTAIEKIEKLGGKVFLSPKFEKKEEQTRAIKKAGGKIILASEKEAKKVKRNGKKD